MLNGHGEQSSPMNWSLYRCQQRLHLLMLCHVRLCHLVAVTSVGYQWVPSAWLRVVLAIYRWCGKPHINGSQCWWAIRNEKEFPPSHVELPSKLILSQILCLYLLQRRHPPFPFRSKAKQTCSLHQNRASRTTIFSSVPLSSSSLAELLCTTSLSSRGTGWTMKVETSSYRAP